MTDRSINDQLDDAVTAILAGRDVDLTSIDASIAGLVELCADLRGLPTTEFKQQLQSQLPGREVMSTPMQKIVPIPEGHPRVSPYLCYDDAAAAIEFYKAAFGAEEEMRLTEPGGKIGHAELRIADALIMLSDEYPDYGAVSPRTLGGSPVKMHLWVEDVDAFAKQALTAGATLVRPIEDQFHGDRTGQLLDPFGYTWIVATHRENVSIEEMQRRLDSLFAAPPAATFTKPYMREGFHTVTPYLTVERAPELVDFLKDAFGATEIFRTTGSAGGMHAEVKVGDSMLMIGGGPGIPESPGAIHLYLPEVDAVYKRALQAGATSIMEPADQPYGERSAGVEDPTGNRWYIATPFVPLPEIDKDLHTVSLYFHPIGAPKLIEFLKEALGAEEVLVNASEDGYVYHAKMRLGDSIVELGEAREPSQPMRMAIYMYVEDCDALYQRALSAGATSMLPPADQPYGDRNAWVSDPFGNVWYLATHLKQGGS